MVGIVAASVIGGAFLMRRRLLKSDHD